MSGWAVDSLTWPSTDGVVVESKYTSGVSYTYKVAGQEHLAGRYTYRSSGVSSDNLRHLYPVGTAVTVFYDPDVPSRAVLKVGGDFLTYWGITLFGISWCVIGAICFYRAWRATP